MKLFIKLPLVFVLSLLLLCAGGLFGIYEPNPAATSFEHELRQQVAGNETGAEFSTNVAPANPY